MKWIILSFGTVGVASNFPFLSFSFLLFLFLHPFLSFSLPFLSVQMFKYSLSRLFVGGGRSDSISFLFFFLSHFEGPLSKEMAPWATDLLLYSFASSTVVFASLRYL